jgi:hypothetical protein
LRRKGSICGRYAHFLRAFRGGRKRPEALKRLAGPKDFDEVLAIEAQNRGKLPAATPFGPLSHDCTEVFSFS